MKKFLRFAFAFLLVCLTTGAFTQRFISSQWAWMSGDKTVNHAGVYGTKGVAASTNKPGSRAFSNSWTDASGNLWLFGGVANAESSFSLGRINDLWKYDPTADQWTWVTGENTLFGAAVYGTKGVAAPTNTPGSRYASVSWTDGSGNLWLFGGYGAHTFGGGYLNDLWKFDPASNQWTWVSGDNTGNNLSVYGTKGVADATNKPGGRQNSISWMDASGKLWLFGGYYTDALDQLFYLNDLWKYDPTTDLWTWVSGDNTANSTGSFGTKGVAAVSNKPDARIDAVSWKDASGGDLWLFGGLGYAVGVRNDLWKYNIASDLWTWVSGDNASNVPGVYGTMGVAAVTNKPGSRRNAVTWGDASGNLWLFGGLGFAPSNGALNDVWKFDPTINQWTWAGGNNTTNDAGAYGTKGVPTCSNKPAAREGAVSWTDGSGDVWIFGGTHANPSDHFNDLWKLTNGAPTASTNPASAISFTGGTLNGSAGDHGLATTTTFEYGTSPTLTGATSVPATIAATFPCHTAAATLTGLVPNTTYYFRIKASNSAGTALGSVLSFTTTPGGALNFDGTNDYVEIPTSPSLEEFVSSGQLSIEYWIKPGAPTGQYRDVISRAPTDVPHSNADYLVEGDPNSLNYLHYVRIFNYTTQNVEYISVPVTYTVNEWQHIAITAKTGGSLKVYRNGVLQGTASLANCAFVTSSCPTRLMYDARVLGFFQNGNLDEVRLWSRELTATEIANNMNCEITAGGTNLNANYHFNQGGAGGDNPGETTLLDASGNANNAALKNFALNGSTSNWVTPGGIGYEINVQGNSVDITDGDATPSVTDSTDYGNVATGSNLAHLFSIQNSGSGSLTISSITVTGTNAAEFVVTGAPTSVGSGSSSPFTVTFTPGATGLRTAVIHVNNNDCNESDYDFVVQGSGVVNCAGFSNNRAYVNVNATGGNNGTSWANAFTKLQDALAITNSCSNINQIWVAKGTYYPDEGSSQVNNDRNATFTLKNGVAIYGGFAGTETTLSQRNLKINATILSGDIDADNTLANNAYHVTTASGNNSTAVIDGFTITAGNASDNGGGMLNNSGSPIISNCTFSGNRAANGGGLYNNTASPTITNCIFSGNVASNLGGAMSNGSSSLSLINCTISGNVAGGGGGGGIYSLLGSGTITNCIFWNNKDVNGIGTSGSSIFNFATSLTISYSLVQGQNGGTGNLDGTNAANNPLFVTAVDPLTAPTTGGDFHLQPGSPAINAGTNSGAPNTDIEGNPRLLTLADPADMGAYELSTIPHASIADKSITEGNSGTTLMKFKVTLDHAYGGTVKIKYATADSTATVGSDYVAATGTVAFKPGVISKSISITINGDVTVEPNERFKVMLSKPSNVLLSDSLAIGTIKNDDVAPVGSAFTVNESKAAEALGVQVMPNPNKGNFTLQMQLPAKVAATTLTLYNSLGQKAWQEDLGMVSGSIIKNIYLESKLPSGVYMLIVERNDAHYSMKVVISK